jgi:hypothetical protein
VYFIFGFYMLCPQFFILIFPKFNFFFFSNFKDLTKINTKSGDAIWSLGNFSFKLFLIVIFF